MPREPKEYWVLAEVVELDEKQNKSIPIVQDMGQPPKVCCKRRTGNSQESWRRKRVEATDKLGRMRAPGDVSRVSGLPGDDAVWMTEQCRSIEGMMKWSGGFERRPPKKGIVTIPGS